jgi:hypothetical protein
VRVAGTVKRVVRPLLSQGAAPRTIRFGPLRGQRMEIDFSDQVRFYLGVFEIELVPWFRAFCPPGTDSFDIGAREGYVALMLARLSAGGRVLAVEADPAELERLGRNIALNPSLPCVPEPRLARVTGPSSDDREVTLDDLAFGAAGFVPDLVKLDVEGWEQQALQGGERLLGERRPHLVVETHSAKLERACADLLVGRRYAPRVVEPRRWLPEVWAGHNRWLVAEGVPLRAEASPAGTGPRNIGTKSAQAGTEPSHRSAKKVDSVEHEGGGWFSSVPRGRRGTLGVFVGGKHRRPAGKLPTLAGWGAELLPAGGDMPA